MHAAVSGGLQLLEVIFFLSQFYQQFVFDFGLVWDFNEAMI
jgi:hypothetical protein